jgi:hypothetical protein
MTFAASVNSARERAAGSAIEAKADGDCNPLPPDICAEPGTDASTAAQLSEVNNASVRMMYRSRPLVACLKERAIPAL